MIKKKNFWLNESDKNMCMYNYTITCDFIKMFECNYCDNFGIYNFQASIVIPMYAQYKIEVFELLNSNNCKNEYVQIVEGSLEEFVKEAISTCNMGCMYI